MREPDSRLARSSTLALIAVAGIWAASRAASSGDLWVALGCGRAILAHGVTGIDPFSFTSPPGAWVNQNWLSHVLFTLLHKAAGLTALGIWKVAVCIAITYFTASSARALGAPRFAAALAAIGMAFAGRPFYDIRPNLHTILLSAILVRWVVGIADRRWQRYWPIPLTFALWGNLHGGFLFGVIGLAAAVGSLAAARIFRRMICPGWPQAALLPVLALLAVLLSPYGIKNLTHPYLIALGPDAAHWRAVAEWLPPFTAGGPVDGGVRAFGLLLSLSLLLVAGNLALRRLSGPSSRGAFIDSCRVIPVAAVALAALFLSLVSRRFIPLFAVAAIPLLAVLLARLLPLHRRPALVLPILLLVSLLASGIDIAPRLLLPNPLWPASDGWASRLARTEEQPRDAVGFLLRARAVGRIFTNWTWGGYLLYEAPFDGDQPRFRIYIDGRAQAAYPASVSMDYSTFEQAAHDRNESAVRAFLDHYRIDYCVLDRRETALARFLPEVSGWVGIYADDRAIVLTRSGPQALQEPPRDAYPDEAIYHASAAFRLRTGGGLTGDQVMAAFQHAVASSRARPTTTGVTEMTQIALAAPEPMGTTLRGRAAAECDRILEGDGASGPPYDVITVTANTAQCRAALATASDDPETARRMRAEAAEAAARASLYVRRILR